MITIPPPNPSAHDVRLDLLRQINELEEESAKCEKRMEELNMRIEKAESAPK
jgi:hypothetical protein